jgi:two-component system phosphate regulon sensor histidine kinase PhoR
MSRSSSRWPIILGVIMIVLVVALTVGWIVVNATAASESERAGFYYTLLAVGTTLLVLVLVGTVMYLTITVKTVRLAQQQSNFIDSVTHELKSPIASLKLYLQTLEKRKLPEEQVAEVHNSMLEVLGGLDHLIDHLLEAARLEKGVVETPIEEVDLPAVLEQCAATTTRLYRLAPAAISLQLQPIPLWGHTKELEIVFRNLIDNAVKYSGNDPKIEIVIYTPSSSTVGVRISDNGPGVPAKLRRKIFGRFVRLGNELERKQAGTGLGLYIVRELVKRMRGKIYVHSRSPLPGTSFEVELPRRPG